MVVSSWKRFTRTGVVSKEMPLSMVCIWVQTLDPYERKRGVNVDMGPKFGPISTPDQEIPPSTNRKVRYPVQQSGARRAFRARAPRSARSVAAGGRIFRLRCWRSAVFEQATNVLWAKVLPVCNFSTDRARFWAFRAGELTEERRRREKKRRAGRGVPLSTVSI